MKLKRIFEKVVIHNKPFVQIELSKIALGKSRGLGFAPDYYKI